MGIKTVIPIITDYPKLGDSHDIFRQKADIAWSDLAAAIPAINTWTDEVNSYFGNVTDTDLHIIAENADNINVFWKVYLGAKSTEPTLRNDGSPLLVGDMYFDTARNRMRVYDGSIWNDTSDEIVDRLNDVNFIYPTNGVILIDRATNLKYRLFIDNGNLGIEEVI